METIACIYENHSLDSWKSLEGNGKKGYGNCNLLYIELIISNDAWNFCVPSVWRKFPLGTWKPFQVTTMIP
jgi:hypothetical protein